MAGSGAPARPPVARLFDPPTRAVAAGRPTRYDVGMDENTQIVKRRGPDDRMWFIVAEAMGVTDAEIVAGLLRSAGIPVYLFREALGTAMPLTVGLVGGVQVGVPEAYYAEAKALLESDQDTAPPAFDTDEDWDDPLDKD